MTLIQHEEVKLQLEEELIFTGLQQFGLRQKNFLQKKQQVKKLIIICFSSF